MGGPLCFIASLADFSVPKSLYNSMRVLTEEENIDNAIKMVECAKHVMHVSKNVHEWMATETPQMYYSMLFISKFTELGKIRYIDS